MFFEKINFFLENYFKEFVVKFERYGAHELIAKFKDIKVCYASLVAIQKAGLTTSSFLLSMSKFFEKVFGIFHSFLTEIGIYLQKDPSHFIQFSKRLCKYIKILDQFHTLFDYFIKKPKSKKKKIDKDERKYVGKFIRHMIIEFGKKIKQKYELMKDTDTAINGFFFVMTNFHFLQDMFSGSLKNYQKPVLNLIDTVLRRDTNKYLRYCWKSIVKINTELDEDESRQTSKKIIKIYFFFS